MRKRPVEIVLEQTLDDLNYEITRPRVEVHGAVLRLVQPEGVYAEVAEPVFRLNLPRVLVMLLPYHIWVRVLQIVVIATERARDRWYGLLFGTPWSPATVQVVVELESFRSTFQRLRLRIRRALGRFGQ